MSIKINTRFGEVVTSQAINEKVNTLFGGNVVIEGFDVTKNTNTSICITPGKAIVCGASIEEDEETINLNIPTDLLTAKTLYVVIEYVHETRSVKYKIVAQVSASMVTLAQITMVNSVIDIVENSEKTLQLNELSEVAKDLETGLLNTQYLEVSGEDITLTDGYRSRTENMKLKGNTKQNLVLVPNKEVIPSGMLNLDGACNHKIDNSKAGFVDFSIKGRTIKNLVENINPYESSSISDDVCTIQSLESGFAITDINLKHPLKANTKYTAFINILEVTDEKFMLDSFGIAAEWTAHLARLSSVGLNKIVFTTPSQTRFIRIQMKNNPGNYIKFNKNILILEGDWSSSEIDEIPCIDGIAGAGDKSKNLFSSEWEYGALNPVTGSITTSSDHYVSDYIKVNAGAKIVFSNNGVARATNVAEYDNNFNHIGGSSTGVTVYTLSQNTKYIKCGGSMADRDKFQIEEGSAPTEYQPCNTYKVEVLSHGKNLWDLKNKSFPGFIEFTYGTLHTPDCQNRTSDFIKVKPSTTYTYMTTVDVCSDSHPISWNAVAWYDENKNYITRSTKTGNTMGVDTIVYTLQSPSNAAYVRVGSRYLESDSAQVTFVEGVISEHIPYEEDKVQIFLDEPLHYLAPNVYDEVTVDGELIRNVGKIVFDGSENWRFNSNNDTNILFDCLDLGLPVSSDAIISDKFESIQSLWSEIQGGSTQEGIDIGGPQGSRFIQISIKQSRLASASISAFSDWLKKNPVTVLYEAAEKEVTKIDTPRIATFDGITYVKTSSEIQPEIKIDSKGNKYPALLKPNIEYTVRWFARGGDTNLDLDLGGTKLSVNKTASIVKVTSPATLVHENLYVAGWNTIVKDITVIEGESSEVYFQGIAGVGDKSKNIMSSNIEYGTIDSVDGLPVSDIRYDRKRTVDFIKVNPNKSYVYSSNIGESKVNWYAYDENKKYISFLGYNDKIVTPHNCYYIKYHNGLPENYDLSLVCDQIEEGTVSSDYVPYYSGHKVKITNVGKNLAKHTSGYFENKESWCFLNGKRMAFLDHLMKSNTKFLLRKGEYIFNYSDSSCKIQLCVGNEEKVYHRKQVITLKRDAYCVFRVAANSDGIIQWSDLQLEKGTEITSFEPYKEYTNSIYLDEPLMKLPNGVCDEIIGDKLIRRVGKVVLDGDEQCNMHNYSNDNFGLFYVQPKDTGVKNAECEVICSKFPVYKGTAETLRNESIEYTWKGYNSGRAFWFWIKADRLESVSVNSFKNWLSLNPITIYYELQSPIITSLDADLNLRTHNGINNITTNCTVKPNLSFKSANNLRAVVNQVADRITEAEKLVDELLLPNIVEVDYERTLLEFDYEVSKFNLEGDE